MNAKKIFIFLPILLSAFLIVPNLHADTQEVEYSTYSGEFSNGGEYETSERLIGNASFYGFGIIQGNLVRIYIASGAHPGNAYDSANSTPTTAGYVGIWTDGINQIPQHHLDVWGRLRSTDSAYFATSQGYVGVGTSNPSYKFQVEGGSISLNGRTFINGVEVASSAVTLSVDTTTLKTRIDNLDSSTGTITTRLNNIATDTSTLKTRIDGLSYTVSMSSLTVYGSITSTTGYNGGKSTGTFGGLRADIYTLADGTFLSSSPFSSGGGGGGSTFPVLTYVYIATVPSSSDLISVTAKCKLGNSELSFSTHVTLSKVGTGGTYEAVSANTWYEAWLGYDSSSFTVLVASYPISMYPNTVGTFTNWERLGSIRTNASSKFVGVQGDGNSMNYMIQEEIAFLTTNADIDVSKYVPPSATNVRLRYMVDGDATGNNSFRLAGYGCTTVVGNNTFGNNSTNLWRGADVFSFETNVGFCSSDIKFVFTELSAVDTIVVQILGWEGER